MLRIDDTDLERSRPELAAAIERDLQWLGLSWDLFARQSDRFARYAAAAETLKAQGFLYPCFESEEELALKRKTQLARGLPPLYDRASLKLTPAEIAERQAKGEVPHWRFKLSSAAAAWDDQVQGSKRFEGAALSDPVLIRADGVPLYTFSSVIDDADFGVTHIIRGEDHVANTAVQIKIFEAMGAAVPQFAHLPLLTGAGGEELSKRLGTLSIATLRDEMGIEPMSIVSYLGRLGTADAIEPQQDIAAVIAGFDLAKVGRAPPKFDMAELRRLNGKLLHQQPYAAVHHRLLSLGLPEVGEAFWLVARSAIEQLSDVRVWWDIVAEPLSPILIDPAVTTAAAASLPSSLEPAGFSAWTTAIKAATGKSGPLIYKPLRLALTGREDGPELKNLLPLLGREKVMARLSGQTA